MDLIHRFLGIKMILEHVLYLTYEMPAAALRPVVPALLPLATAGDDRAFLSVVLLRCRHVHASGFPFLQFDYRQINLRTYVKDPATGEQAVYFLRSAVTSPLISVMTRLIGIPWERGLLNLNVCPPEGEHGFRYDAAGHHRGDIEVRAGELGPLPTDMPPFRNTREAVAFLILPLTGFFGRKGQIQGFHIEHPALHPQTLKLRAITLPLLKDMALLRESDLIQPHSVLYVPEATFRIYLPARTVR